MGTAGGGQAGLWGCGPYGRRTGHRAALNTRAAFELAFQEAGAFSDGQVQGKSVQSPVGGKRRARSGTGQKQRKVLAVLIRTQARLWEESGSRLKSVDGSVVSRFSKSAEEGPAGCVLTW